MRHPRALGLAFVVGSAIVAACAGTKPHQGPIDNNNPDGGGGRGGDGGITPIDRGQPTMPRACGNGERTADEACDDGNKVDGDGCSADCKVVEPVFSCVPPGIPCHRVARCGDGVVQAGEDCDPGISMGGSEVDTDTCTRFCKLSTCGDGYVNAIAGEQCDDANTSNEDACTNSCKPRGCGDGIVQVDLGEQCDTGGVDTVACNGSTCTNNGGCGDGYANTAVGEQCDSGGTDTATCVGSTCKLSFCGDRHVNRAAGEACDTAIRPLCPASGLTTLTVCDDTCAEHHIACSCSRAGASGENCFPVQ